jgi:ribA/ribD-fused uncharacterized protein
VERRLTMQLSLFVKTQYAERNDERSQLMKIDSFKNEHHFLSNFYPCLGVRCKHTDACRSSLEIEYQAAKASNDVERNTVLASTDAAMAKKLGKRIVLRFNWDDVKLDVMRSLLKKKFDNPVLRKKLLATGDAELIEGNWWGDTFWGVCRGTGQNWLGRLLMELRSSLCANCANEAASCIDKGDNSDR